MRKELIASLSMLGSLAASGAAAAQTCATPPSCETLGFTKSETDCEGLEALKCPFDQSKLYCPQGGGNMSAAAPGAILYSDGTISDSVIASKTPVGIVAYVNGSTGFAVALMESNQTWGGYGYNVSCLGDMDSGAASADMNGRVNTQCLVSDSRNCRKLKFRPVIIGLRPSTTATTPGTSARPTASCTTTALRVAVGQFVVSLPSKSKPRALRSGVFLHLFLEKFFTVLAPHRP
ncbi:MAG: hypothetical protein KHX61_03050, partial [Proteobacteria bacterium]|nr:hypothetical protein [Pseudomonadota bacterium]